MKLGVTFPQLDFGADAGGFAPIRRRRRISGIEYLLAYDHVLGADVTNRPGWSGYTNADSFHEPFVLFAFMSAVAPKLEFVTGVIILPQRQTVAGRQTGGRGRHPHRRQVPARDRRGLEPRRVRGAERGFRQPRPRVEEQIELMRTALDGAGGDVRGPYHRVTEAGLNPLPIQRPIPIWIGGTADVVLERTARIADGWFPLGRCNPENLERINRLRDLTEAAGRDRHAVGIDARIDMRACAGSRVGRGDRTLARSRGDAPLDQHDVPGLLDPGAHRRHRTVQAGRVERVSPFRQLLTCERVVAGGTLRRPHAPTSRA